MQIGDPYKVLGVDANATASEIRKAYRSLVKKYHPDKNKSPSAAKQFLAIQTAYEQICNGVTTEFETNSVRHKETQFEQDLEKYKQRRQAAREKLRHKKRQEEAYRLAFIKRLKSGKIKLWHLSIAYFGMLLFGVVWIDFFMGESQHEIVVKSYGIRTYGSIDDHSVQLLQSTDNRYFWCADFKSEQLQKVQSLKAIETPWLHQVKALSFNDGIYKKSIAVHFSFYWAQIWLSFLFLIPLVSWYFASADILFVAGSFISRYFILAFILWFLISENRFIHLFSFGLL